MFVSVIVPVFNVDSDLLRSCFDSLRSQTLRQSDFEIVVVDDGSTNPDTVATIEHLVQSSANARLVRHEANKGLNEARRSGVFATEGEFVLFVDGDDSIARDAIEILRMEAAQSGADLVTAPFIRWDTSRLSSYVMSGNHPPFATERWDRLRDLFSFRHSFSMCGRLMRRSLLASDVLDVPPWLLHEDLATFTRLLFRCGNVSHSFRPIYYYTVNPSSITQSFSETHIDSMLWAIDDWKQAATLFKAPRYVVNAIPLATTKLLDIAVERTIASDIPLTEKSALLSRIRASGSNLAHLSGKLNASFLDALLDTNADEKGYALTLEDRADELVRPATVFSGIGPSSVAKRLKDKVVFIGQVDYQLRSAAMFAAELRKQGHACVVLDNSEVASNGRRRLREEDTALFFRTEHIHVTRVPYGLDWLSTARIVVVFNDFDDDFREALEYRHRLGLPTVGVVEGINDFLRADFDEYRFLPYRRCDWVFLAGDDDTRFFEDRKTRIVGMPVVDELSKLEATFPEQPLGVLNVNFTYGVLEDERDSFVDAASSAFDQVGLRWTITQHPSDTGSLSDFPVSSRSQYELIDEATVFVSRFATGIIEALASGKPAIYFNPHNEQVDKFKTPLGAFDIATTTDELVEALRKALADVQSGIDFRARATSFLEHHTGLSTSGRSATLRFADSIKAAVEHAEIGRWTAMLDNFYSALQEPVDPQPSSEPNLLFGGYSRDTKAELVEEELISQLLPETGLMIDVGANFGNSCDIFLGRGWTVHAFEPDPRNRDALVGTWPDEPRLVVNAEAVSNELSNRVAFYASDESTGISSLRPFTSGHRKVGEVSTTTLRDYYQQHAIEHTNFLKIDVEGYDKFVLDGFPWQLDLPDAILAEFDDAKTKPLGYDTHAIAHLLLEQGYSVYVSLWHPVLRYGTTHNWRALLSYSSDLELADSWGNLIAFLDHRMQDRAVAVARRVMRFSDSVDDAVSGEPLRLKRPFYFTPGEWLKSNTPKVFGTARFLRRLLVGDWRWCRNQLRQRVDRINDAWNAPR